MRFFLLPLVLVFGVVRCVKFAVNVEEPMQGFSYRTLTGMAMFEPSDAPSSRSPGNGRSYIEFRNFKIDRTDAGEEFDEAVIQFVVLPDYDVGSIGIDRRGQNYFCCTPTILQTQQYAECKKESQLNKLISTLEGYDNQEDGNYHMVKFDSNQKHLDASTWRYTVKDSEIHIIAVAVCDPRVGQVTFSGETIWMNPYGHLPGQLYGFLPFYGWMCVVYILVACVWFSLNAMYWNDLLHVQNCITGVLLMCMIEMATWYFDYLNLNNNGVRHKAPFIIGMMTSVSRRTVARMLVVAVSMGYGVVKPILGDEKKKIILLGATYWCFAFAFEVLIHYSQTQEVSPALRTILTPPVAILDGYFWWWIFESLNNTILNLLQKKQSAKLALYKRFSWCLGIALAVAFIFACYQFYYVWMKLYLANWQIMWVLEVGFWQVLFTIVFLSIMVLWRPSKHASRYAYAQELATEETDDAEVFENNLMKPDIAEDAEDYSLNEHELENDTTTKMT